MLKDGHLVDTIYYNGSTIQFVSDLKNRKQVYWIVIDDRPLTFVSKLETAKRIAVRFIDVVDGDEFTDSQKWVKGIGYGQSGSA